MDAAPAVRPARSDARDSGLTGRELLVVQLLARGYSSGQIATLLHVTASVVEAHERAARAALGAATAADALDATRRRGLIE